MNEPIKPSASAIDLEDQAIEHWVHLTSGRASEADHRAFARWRRRSAEHEAAARLAERMWQALPQTRSAQSFVVPASVARRPLRWAALATGVGALALTGLSEPAKVYFADYATPVGERRALTLEDGSQVWLNSGSALSVHYSSTRREISLIKGEALFQVSKDASRPFVVQASGGSVQAVGTRFDVDRQGEQVRVGVTEGEVKVSSGGAVVPLKAAQRLEYAAGAAPSATGALDLGTASAWQRGKLIFNRQPLAEVFADIERYLPGSLVIAGRLPSTAVSGVFNLDDIPGMLDVLARTQPVRIYRMPWLTLVVVNQTRA
ncbi:FecR family protein [Pseudomonas sp. CFBP 13719]|uniref:FecR family protein n=1 Tax=Pseudomonas sp. CFBP 13719 TaxID=2775303 RepID=UPI00177BDEA3|nr:FecR family protein [Pseudomonas sp. CFBP 13719]MBD8680156.1 FecR family protein [Pseudomonas sp. CFBP 13719]